MIAWFGVYLRVFVIYLTLKRMGRIQMFIKNVTVYNLILLHVLICMENKT